MNIRNNIEFEEDFEKINKKFLKNEGKNLILESFKNSIIDNELLNSEEFKNNEEKEKALLIEILNEKTEYEHQRMTKNLKNPNKRTDVKDLSNWLENMLSKIKNNNMISIAETFEYAQVIYRYLIFSKNFFTKKIYL